MMTCKWPQRLNSFFKKKHCLTAWKYQGKTIIATDLVQGVVIEKQLPAWCYMFFNHGQR